MAVVTVAYCETTLACLGTGVNPVLAIPCASGLVNLIGKNYNSTNPELSETMDVVSGGVDFLHDYIVKGKKIDAWDQIVNLIDETNSYYNERKEKMHQNAELIRASLKEEREMKRNQSYEEKTDCDPVSVSQKGGIIEKAVKKLDVVDLEIKAIDDNLVKLFKAGKLTKEITESENTRKKGLQDKKIEIKKAAADEFNDSLKSSKPYSWKKTDGEIYYSITGLKFTGIRWNKYDDMPSVNFEVTFSSRMKPKYVMIFGEMKKIETYMMNLGFQWYDKKMKLTNGMLVVNKDIRAAGKLTFAIRWFDFLNTPVINFNKSDFRVDYSLPQK